jgi:hypothetical protein
MTTNDHDEVFSLIPWYIKGKLTAGEHDKVEWHLASCEICQNEAVICQNLTKAMPQAAETWKPSAAHFAGILAEVEKLESSAEIHREKTLSRPKAKGLFQRIKETVAATPGPMRWTLAFETLAIAGLVAIAILPLQFHMYRDRDTGYETLSNADKPLITKGKLIKLVFADDMTTKELNVLLSQNGLQLREGPSAVGAYVVETPSSDAEKPLAALKAHPKVRLALLLNS